MKYDTVSLPDETVKLFYVENTSLDDVDVLVAFIGIQKR